MDRLIFYKRNENTATMHIKVVIIWPWIISNFLLRLLLVTVAEALIRMKKVKGLKQWLLLPVRRILFSHKISVVVDLYDDLDEKFVLIFLLPIPCSYTWTKMVWLGL